MGADDRSREVDLTGRPRAFHLLDLLRGLAAMSVITLHFPQAFAPLVAQQAYLAVDLFFAMSGFVLAFAYDQRLRDGMSAGGFMVARLIRLYPFYVLALLPSLVEFAYAYRDEHINVQIGLSSVLNLLMIPAPPMGLRDDPLFPANFVAWTLAFELLANLIYALSCRWLTGARLTLLVAASGLLVGLIALSRGDLNGGAYWFDLHLAVARVMFSFFLGVLLFRCHFAGRLPDWRGSAVLPVGATILALGLPVPDELRGLFDGACVLIVFPALLIAAVSHPPRPRSGVATFLGDVSYPIYVLQIPVFNALVLGAPHLQPGLLERAAPWSGLLGLVTLCGAVWWLLRYYDIPTRRWLVNRAGRQGTSRRAATALFKNQLE